MVGLIGREAECERLVGLLEGARGVGESGSLVIRGAPGVGKTALLEFAASRANDMSVLRIGGTEAESGLAFAGLFGLLRPVLDKLECLVEVQAEALAGALGLAPSTSSDRFLVSAAVLGVLAAAGEDNPILCLIDDAQWLDRPSADALVFASRRLGADPVAILFTAADVEGSSFDAPGLGELVVEPVDDESAAAILDAVGAQMAAGVRERLLAEAAGNPLALLELPRGLSDAQLLGEESLPEQIHLTPRLRDIFQRRVERLPEPTQLALLVCALDGTGEAGIILGAGERLGVGAAALEPAEAARLIKTTGERIAFRHPLVRSALVDAAPLNQRQRVHVALAETLSGEEHLDRRVWHQAMAALTGDEEVALALDASARRAQERGGHAAAAVAFQRAAELTRNEDQFAPRLAAAAEAAWNAGQGERALTLSERALRFCGDDLRVRLLHLRGLIEEGEGRFREAAETLLAAARLSGDASLTLRILVDIAVPAMESGFPEELAVDLGRQAEALPAKSSIDSFNRSVALWIGRQHERRFDEAQVMLDQVIRLSAEFEDDPRAQWWAGLLAWSARGEGAGLVFANRAVKAARRQGRLDLLPNLIAFQAWELAGNSLFEQAYAAALDGYQLALDMGLNPAWSLLTLARVEAIRGEADAAREHAEEALARGRGAIFVATLAGATLGLLELGCGSPETAADLLLNVAPGERLNADAVASVPDLIEAIMRAGRSPDEGELSLKRFRRAGSMSTDLKSSLLARCEALLGTRVASEAFAEALLLADSLSPFERARTHLLYGEWQRREGQRKEARVHLRAAAEEFRRLGASPWQERAEAELRASGETARKREPWTIRELTPQELQIAQLAAEGYTNPEIGAQLFLSRKTVEYHLSKVFSKLGITGRQELIRRGAAEAGDPGQK